jgi:hypothetical protein
MLSRIRNDGDRLLRVRSLAHELSAAMLAAAARARTDERVR